MCHGKSSEKGVLTVTRGLLVIALAVMISAMIPGGAIAQPATEMKELPALKIVSPSNGATVSSPVIVIFETSADLSEMTMGAMEKTAPHLHIDLDKRIAMPGMKQLTKVRTHRYRYNLGKATPGRHTIRVYWADAEMHKPMGAVQTVTITVR